MRMGVDGPLDVLFGVRLQAAEEHGGEPWRVSWRYKGQRKTMKVEGLTEASAEALKQRIARSVANYEPLPERLVSAWSYERMSERPGI